MLDFNTLGQKQLCFPCVIIQHYVTGFVSLGPIETLDYFSVI